jgi:hypothetical protein
MAPTLDPDIFKAYDVRGTYPDQVHEDAARAIGAAFVAYHFVAESSQLMKAEYGMSRPRKEREAPGYMLWYCLVAVMGYVALQVPRIGYLAEVG